MAVLERVIQCLQAFDPSHREVTKIRRKVQLSCDHWVEVMMSASELEDLENELFFDNPRGRKLPCKICGSDQLIVK